MKRNFIKSALATLLLLITANVSAVTREACGEPRGKFTNVGFVYSNFEQDNYPKLHSNIGFNLTKGRTYYLHKPIANMLRIGIDAVWSDLSYSNYKVNEYYSLTDETDMAKYTIHEMAIGMQVGPSVTVNLCKRLQMSAYFRYNPSLQCIYNDGFFAGFGNMFTGGFSVNYGAIGLGVETRFGQSKMKSILNFNSIVGGDDEEDDEEVDKSSSKSSKITSKFSGVRAYICFRF